MRHHRGHSPDEGHQEDSCRVQGDAGLLETMDQDSLSAEDAACLSKALIPTDQERRELGAYLNGTHPNRGEKSLEKLAFVDQLFAAVLALPRLEPRLKALAFSKNFHADVAKAAAQLEILEAAIVELRTSEGFTQLLGTALNVINGLNAHNSRLDGQHAAAGLARVQDSGASPAPAHQKQNEEFIASAFCGPEMQIS